MKLRIAIQKQGRLLTDSLTLLKQWGLQVTITDRLIIPCSNAPIEIVTLRQSDIPRYVAKGIVDFGIVGNNLLREQARAVQTIQPLGFARCRLVIAAPQASIYKTIASLQGKRIATSYPNSLQAYLDDIELFAKIVVMEGSVEIAPALNLAEAVCDLTQTGNTLRDHQLIELGEVYNTQAVFIGPRQLNSQQTTFIQQTVLSKAYATILS